eukprot:365041-Chlamydomonas_euryale.AAC.5
MQSHPGALAAKAALNHRMFCGKELGVKWCAAGDERVWPSAVCAIAEQLAPAVYLAGRYMFSAQWHCMSRRMQFCSSGHKCMWHVVFGTSVVAQPIFFNCGIVVHMRQYWLHGSSYDCRTGLDWNTNAVAHHGCMLCTLHRSHTQRVLWVGPLHDSVTNEVRGRGPCSVHRANAVHALVLPRGVYSALMHVAEEGVLCVYWMRSQTVPVSMQCGANSVSMQCKANWVSMPRKVNSACAYAVLSRPGVHAVRNQTVSGSMLCKAKFFLCQCSAHPNIACVHAAQI